MHPVHRNPSGIQHSHSIRFRAGQGEESRNGAGGDCRLLLDGAQHPTSRREAVVLFVSPLLAEATRYDMPPFLSRYSHECLHPIHNWVTIENRVCSPFVVISFFSYRVGFHSRCPSLWNGNKAWAALLFYPFFLCHGGGGALLLVQGMY